MSTLRNESDLVEPVIGQDVFRRPKILKPTEVICTSVLMILFGKPGCFPSIPELGMDIRQYRLARLDEIDTEGILAVLRYQCGLLRENIIANKIGLRRIYTTDKKPCLLFTIPVYTSQDKNTIVIGISNDGDETTYNYKLVNEMLMI